MTNEELINKLKELGFVEYTFPGNYMGQCPYMYSRFGRSVLFLVDFPYWQLRYSYEDGFEYADNGTWQRQPIDKGLSLESILLLYGR